MTEELKIHVAKEVGEQMESDAELAEAMRDMFAVFRQAHHAVEAGQYKTLEDALEAIMGNRPEPVDVDGEPFQ